jgi:hypothetical protein
MKARRHVLFILLVWLCGGWPAGGAPIGTAFDYRGALNNAGSPANGPHDFQFALYDAEIGGTVKGPTLACNGVNVSNGMFTVRLDFGDQVTTFNGEARWLEINVRSTPTQGWPKAFTTLAPRQPASLTHYALYANYAGGLVADHVAVGKQLEVGDSSPESELAVYGRSQLYGDAHVQSNLSVVGAISAPGGITASTLTVEHGATFKEGLYVEDGTLEVNRGLVTHGDVWFDNFSEFHVIGGHVKFNCPVTISNLLWTSDLTVAGQIGGADDRVTFRDALRGSGDVLSVDGDFTVSQKATIFGSMDVNQHLQVLGGMNVGGGLSVGGDLGVTGTKNFVQPHPTDSTKDIVYTCLEGPEAGTYARGSADLVDGEAVVVLPEHFGLVTGDAGLTVQVTPRGAWMQLYVAAVDTHRFSVREAGGRSGHFDYLVQGVRKGYESRPIIRDHGLAGAAP